MNGKLIGQRLALVFLLGLVLLNDPILSLFDKGQSVQGVPVVYLYLMGIWATLIALIAAAIHGRSEHE